MLTQKSSWTGSGFSKQFGRLTSPSTLCTCSNLKVCDCIEYIFPRPHGKSVCSTTRCLSQHLTGLFRTPGSFAAPRLAVLRNLFQKASGAQAEAAADGDVQRLLQDFPHADDVAILLRDSARACTFLKVCLYVSSLLSALFCFGFVVARLVLERQTFYR